METRPPAVAGRFYPGDRATLKKVAAELLIPSLNPPRPAIGVMVPHAGYIYSGATAGKTFASIIPPAVAILLGPNHSGTGPSAAIWDSGSWATPLGEVEVDSVLAKTISRACSKLVPERQSHYPEHSIEVQVPFLQMINPAINIVPILFHLDNPDQLREIGRIIASTVINFSPRPLLVASSDMNHYEAHETTLEKDGPVLEAILALDPLRMWEEVREGRVSMCGVQPVTVMLEAVRGLGGTKGHIVEHTTSGPVSGDFERTVGYAGVIAE